MPGSSEYPRCLFAPAYPVVSANHYPKASAQTSGVVLMERDEQEQK